MSRAGSLLVSFAMRARSGVFNSAALAAIVFTTVLDRVIDEIFDNCIYIIFIQFNEGTNFLAT